MQAGCHTRPVISFAASHIVVVRSDREEITNPTCFTSG